MTEGAPRLLTVDGLRSLLSQLEGSDVSEIELRWPKGRVRLVRDPQPAALGAAPEDTTALGLVTVTAPLTGVYYSRPSPDQEAFVSEGTVIAPGKVVALIETMKLFNEVVAEVEGTVVRLAAADGDLVEKGQTLIEVRPQETGEP